MKLAEYSRVKLISSAHRDQGVEPGALGYIIEVYEDAYEVEFSDDRGNTIAQFVLHDDEVEGAPEP